MQATPLSSAVVRKADFLKFAACRSTRRLSAVKRRAQADRIEFCFPFPVYVSSRERRTVPLSVLLAVHTDAECSRASVIFRPTRRLLYKCKPCPSRSVQCTVCCNSPLLETRSPPFTDESPRLLRLHSCIHPWPCSPFLGPIRCFRFIILYMIGIIP
jgi:hypothetical protein